MTSRSAQRQRRQRRVRKKITGTTSRPRLSVFRSNRHISAQIIDDENGRTVASASTSEADLRGVTTSNKEAAVKVGSLLAERAQEAGIDSVVFDRGGNKYHGRVAALADAARDAGLKF
ncbi:MAG: 50S ribosomal protein L18 [marine actinobacterium MedAcidi-G3]|jgi:large subunit ribosomal protein L18|nr:MAG: 50S ribosomal protein L18 [marine actinobacterium MedAcidi-G3]MAR55364.1 50S ribosomal protein L18 [Acidimicrobiaceae bacterium]MBA4813289.1 50S ribosomal protein L18 [Acidimicrobiales bacterium]OUW86387.1 MAG: 50S ribosomal protein L18 [Acidimicrobiaceae bacterium TMED224]MBD51856.1 50S ribosomal protein L18 [Acidimicrobiaceae bacterium]|tara:strand:+ start:3035 stop:3388 length:354 start_codon:yes stop_codon:yes gene_type:complete